MTFSLRPYQKEAVDAVFNYLENTGGNPILSMATGTGKSVVISEICKRVLSYNNTRILVISHVKEIIEQNHAKMPFELHAGIYSAGIGKSDAHNRAIFCGIQSVYKKANLFSPVTAILIDECHLLSPNQETMYGKFISDLKESNENLKVIGLSATPYRTKDGLLTDTTLFNDIVYDYDLAKATNDGYLCSLKSKGGAFNVDLSGVKITAGEYNHKQMAAAFDRDEITREAVKEIKGLGYNKKSWLIFCSSVEHCYHISEYLHDIPHGIITGKTPKEEREQLIADHKSGKIKALLNWGVLTTGFDNPNVDLIVMLRATKSTSLYVQIMGRGTRPVYASNMPLETPQQRRFAIEKGPKPYCLVLDYGGNIERFGPVDAINIKPRREKDGSIKRVVSIQPTKLCPSCKYDCHARAASCFHCGYLFPIEVKHQEKASDAPIMSADIPIEKFEVDDISFDKHISKKTNIPLLKVTYHSGNIGKLFDWVCLEHQGFARTKARTWWLDRTQGRPPPETIDEALNRVDEIQIPKYINHRKAGKYDEIVGYSAETKNNRKFDRGAKDYSANSSDEIVW